MRRPSRAKGDKRRSPFHRVENFELGCSDADLVLTDPRELPYAVYVTTSVVVHLWSRYYPLLWVATTVALGDGAADLIVDDTDLQSIKQIIHAHC